MIFFSHSSRIHILQLTFALVCSCLEGLLTTEKHHLVPFCLLIFCILCLSIQIKYFFFLDTQGTELKSVCHLLSLYDLYKRVPPPPPDVDAFFGFCKLFHPQAKTPLTLSKFAQFVNCTVCLLLHVAL